MGYEGVTQSAHIEDGKGLSLHGVLGEDFHKGVISQRRLEEGGGAIYTKMLQEVF